MAIKQEAFKKKVVWSINFNKIRAPSNSLAPVNFSQIPWDELILALKLP